MKIIQLLGHNSNWNLDIHYEQGVGEAFLFTAYTHGKRFLDKKIYQKIIDSSMIDLQFYGKKDTTNATGKLSEFDFHPVNVDTDTVTNIYFENCVKEAIKFQLETGFKKIIIPNFYENEETRDIISMIQSMNNYIKSIKHEFNEIEFYMTLPFAHHIIINKEKVEEILVACTDMSIVFDGYFITCETKPETKKKVSTDIKIFKNLTRVFKTLKAQDFKTIYAYANWDAIIYLAETDIDYITIGSFENLRNFDIKRFVEKTSGGFSPGFYFSEKLLNMVKSNDLSNIRGTGNLELILNDKNIFSDIIINENFPWSSTKPDVNKNYLLAVTKLLQEIADIEDLEQRKKHVQKLIDQAIFNYNQLEKRHVFLENESSNYHLASWKTHLANS